MRRIKLILAALACMAVAMSVAAAPATAAIRITTGSNHNFFFNGNDGFVGQGVENESETGNVTENFTVIQMGDNSNQCVTPLQFGNTGSNQNAQGFLQFGSSADDLEGTGGDFTFAPVLNASCDQQVQQSSAASSD